MNKKIGFLIVIVLALIATLALYALFKLPRKGRDAKPLSKIDQKLLKPSKPPKVQTYKQKVIATANAGSKEKDVGIYPGGNETEPEGPTNISVDKDENIYICDTYNGRIKKYDSSGRFLKNIPSPISPEQTLIDSQRNIYVFNEGNYEVYKIDQKGKVLVVYPLSERISPRDATSLIDIFLVNDEPYGGTRYTNGTELVDIFPEGEYSIKLGTPNRAYSPQEQEKSMVRDRLASDGNIYTFELVKRISYCVIKDRRGKEIKRFKEKNLGGGADTSCITAITKEMIYINGFLPTLGYTIQVYSKNGELLAQASPFAKSKGTMDWPWQYISAVSDKGNIFVLSADRKVKEHSVKIIKMTLGKEKR